MWTSSLMMLWILFFAASSGLQGPGQPDPTETKVTIGSNTAASINYLSALLQQAGLWGGIEAYSSGCSPDPEIHFPSLNGTVKDGLTQLKSLDNSLRWNVEGDGILVSKNPPPTSLLDTRIGDFTFYKHDHAEKPTDELLNLPVVKDRISRLNLMLRRPEIGFAQPAVEEHSEDRLVLKDTTLRQALNAIAKADHPRVWLFKQTRCGGETALSVQWVVK